jgi:hypothetical protein
MTDDLFYLPNRPPQPTRQPKSGERLFEFPRGHDRILCEPYDLGDYGLDVRFSMNEEFWYSRRFDPRLDATRTPRELTLQWATEERKATRCHPIRSKQFYAFAERGHPTRMTGSATQKGERRFGSLTVCNSVQPSALV